MSMDLDVLVSFYGSEHNMAPAWVQLGLSFSFESFGQSSRTSCDGLSPNYHPLSKAVKVLKHKVLKGKFLKRQSSS